MFFSPLEATPTTLSRLSFIPILHKYAGKNAVAFCRWFIYTTVESIWNRASRDIGQKRGKQTGVRNGKLALDIRESCTTCWKLVQDPYFPFRFHGVHCEIEVSVSIVDTGCFFSFSRQLIFILSKATGIWLEKTLYLVIRVDNDMWLTSVDVLTPCDIVAKKFLSAETLKGFRL